MQIQRNVPPIHIKDASVAGAPSHTQGDGEPKDVVEPVGQPAQVPPHVASEDDKRTRRAHGATHGRGGAKRARNLAAQPLGQPLPRAVRTRVASATAHARATYLQAGQNHDGAVRPEQMGEVGAVVVQAPPLRDSSMVRVCWTAHGRGIRTSVCREICRMLTGSWNKYRASSTAEP